MGRGSTHMGFPPLKVNRVSIFVEVDIVDTPHKQLYERQKSETADNTPDHSNQITTLFSPQNTRCFSSSLGMQCELTPEKNKEET